MKLIVGLGNPGDVYSGSRHNIGFRVIKALAKDYDIVLKRDNGTSSLSGKGKICGENVILAMPLTFMNLSGTSLKALIEKYEIALENLLVVCDDLDLDFGRLKFRPHGSSGGHRGLESIAEAVGSQNFARLRVGIGRPGKGMDAAEYVLSDFRKEEKEFVKEIIECSCWAVESYVSKGITQTMSTFNKRSSVSSKT